MWIIWYRDERRLKNGCEAHNDVNTRLGKKMFDCGKVEDWW